MARHAESGLRARLERMARAEPSAMQAGEANLVESETRGQRRNDTDAVTPRALAFAVTRRAQVPRARRAHAVLANPIALVHEMTYRQGVLGCQIDVTPVAVARSPLIFVLVAAEAHRHFGPQSFGPF
jgi:hypothetical protein